MLTLVVEAATQMAMRTTVKMMMPIFIRRLTTVNIMMMIPK